MKKQPLLEAPHASIICPYCGTRSLVDFGVENYPPSVKNALKQKGSTVTRVPFKCPRCKNISLYDFLSSAPHKLASPQQDYFRAFFPFKAIKFVGGEFKSFPSFHDYWVMMHAENYERRVVAWWILPNGNILPVVDGIHGTFVLKYKDLFGIKNDQEIEDYYQQNPNKNYYPDSPDFNAAAYVIQTKKGVRSGINFLSQDYGPGKIEGYVEGHHELINKLKNVIYNELIMNGVSTVYVDTEGKQDRQPVPIDRFRKIAYTS